jgi:hypothetical protein
MWHALAMDADITVAIRPACRPKRNARVEQASHGPSAWACSWSPPRTPMRDFDAFAARSNCPGRPLR